MKVKSRSFHPEAQYPPPLAKTPPSNLEKLKHKLTTLLGIVVIKKFDHQSKIFNVSQWGAS
jgi:hypothetical protein